MKNKETREGSRDDCPASQPVQGSILASTFTHQRVVNSDRIPVWIERDQPGWGNQRKAG